ncbi:TolC family protein [Azonexus hydrophilus]|uniref:Protein CyaE n=1 Tax=Azonexus hydrophilus TaxID=418702 RepID=A0ABZ2XI02_9RHOO
MRILLRNLGVLLVGLAGSVGQAQTLTDPLRTEAMLPLRSAHALAARVGELPCADQLPAAPLSALDAVDLALCNHPQTREQWASARAQAAQVGVARSGWLPSVDGRAGVTRNFNETRNLTQQSASLSLSWLLLDGGQRAAGIDNATRLLDAALATRDATVQTLFLSALQTYHGAQAARAAVQAALEAERSAQESLAAAELRYRVGAGTPAERLQAQTAASQARLNRQRAEGEARSALGSLANALGLQAQTPLQLAEMSPVSGDAGFRKDLDTLIAAAIERRPDLKAAEAQVLAAEASVTAARAQGLPTLSLAAGPNWQRVDGVTNRSGAIGLTLNVPLFSGFDTTYRVRAAEAQQEARAAQRDRIRNQVALDVWKAYHSLNTATEALQTTRDLIASAEQSERVALGRYKAGVGSVLDLLSAQTALAQARVQRIQAELDWNIYRAALAQSMGALDYTLLQAAGE